MLPFDLEAMWEIEWAVWGWWTVHSTTNGFDERRSAAINRFRMLARARAAWRGQPLAYGGSG